MPQVFHMARDDADEPESDGSYAKVEAMSVPSVVPGLIKVGDAVYWDVPVPQNQDCFCTASSHGW